MKIVWNKVTWYSKLFALIFFFLTFWTAFYFGMEYQKISDKFGGIYYIPAGGSNPENQPDSGNLTLKVGQDKNLGNFKVILQSVVSDSRCPEDVICIWAGEVSVRVMLSYDGKSVTKEMKLGGIGEVFEGFQVYVTKVTPATNSKKPIKSGDYEVTFHIER